MTPGERVRKIREDSNISVNDLARSADMRPGYLQLIEDNAAEKVHTRTYKKLAECLGVPVDMLFNELEEYDEKQDVTDEMSTGEAVVMRIILHTAIVTGVLVVTLIIFGIVGAVAIYLNRNLHLVS